MPIRWLTITMRWLTVLMPALLMLTVGCSATQSVFEPSTMVAPSPESSPQYREALTIEAIEALGPQLQFPITLAVSQPSSGSGWSADELSLIESWEGPLRDSGFVDRLIVLPEALADSCGWRMSYHCGIDRNRRTAARFHADALLLISARTEVESHANPAAILNATILGLWLVPGHHRNATTVLEGALVDNRNEYLYAFVRAYGEARLLRPLLYARWRRVSARSRLKALQQFGQRMLREVSARDSAEQAQSHGQPLQQ